MNASHRYVHSNTIANLLKDNIPLPAILIHHFIKGRDDLMVS
jgi:hypothetical protein